MMTTTTPSRAHGNPCRALQATAVGLGGSKLRTPAGGATTRRTCRPRAVRTTASTKVADEMNIFEAVVPAELREKVAVREAATNAASGVQGLVNDALALPELPGYPRPLWKTALFSVPTGLVWYGWYKFAVEEELAAYNKQQSSDEVTSGYGGYGTLGPFVLGLGLGPLAELAGAPGGAAWSAVGVVWIYYTQYLLYKRVNELYAAAGKPEPLTVWWLVFPGFNIIVGVRQVHFLAQYWADARVAALREAPMEDPLVSFFPFIGSANYSWKKFLRTPSLWAIPLKDVKDLDIEFLQEP